MFISPRIDCKALNYYDDNTHISQMHLVLMGGLNALVCDSECVSVTPKAHHKQEKRKLSL